MDSNFKVDDLTLPISIRFNRAVEAFVEELVKRLKEFDVRSGSPEYDQNGFIATIPLFKNTSQKFLGVSLNPQFNGRFSYSCYKNGSVKTAEYKNVSLLFFWSDSEQGCFNDMKKLFEQKTMETI